MLIVLFDKVCDRSYESENSPAIIYIKVMTIFCFAF